MLTVTVPVPYYEYEYCTSSAHDNRLYGMYIDTGVENSSLYTVLYRYSTGTVLYSS